MNFTISGIIPAYNAESTLKEVILALKAQTVSLVEIIVVDDGSNDMSAEIASDCDCPLEHPSTIKRDWEFDNQIEKTVRPPDCLFGKSKVLNRFNKLTYFAKKD